MFLTFRFCSAPEEGLYCKPKYRAKIFFLKKNKYISVILAFVVCSIKLVTSAVGISLPLIFCIWDNFLIQVYKWSGTTHWFVAVELQILLYSISMTYSSQQNISFRHFIVVTLNVQCHMAEEQAN